MKNTGLTSTNSRFDAALYPGWPQYTPPEGGTYADWRRNEMEDFKPTPRQQVIINSVQAALDAKMFYTEEVYDFCVKLLQVTPEQAKVGANTVQNGEVGMDFYYARQCIRCQKTFEAERQAFAKLNAFVGMKLGTLVFSDFKRTTNMVVTAVSTDPRQITATGKRGAYSVELSCSAMQIWNAYERATEQGKRKDALNTNQAPSESVPCLI